MIWVYIGFGGAAGAVARFALSGWVQSRSGFHFPWGTLVVNVLGCLLLGFVLRSVEGLRVTPELRAFVTVGVLGAFTTFSTFSYETVALLEDGAIGRAALYSLGSLVVGAAAVLAGMAAAGLLMSPRGWG